MKVIQTMLVLVALTGTATAATSVTVTDAIHAKVDKGLRAVLKDPDSIRLGRMTANQDGKIVFVCGWVNAKNSFGGYTGDQPFSGLFDENMKAFLVIAIGSTDAQRYAVIKTCADKGLALQ